MGMVNAVAVTYTMGMPKSGMRMIEEMSMPYGSTCLSSGGGYT